MKKLLLAALFVFSSIAFAEEVVLLEKELPVMSSSFHTYSDARFHMDTETGVGFAKISVTEDRWMMGGHYDSNGRWYPHRIPMPITVLSETVRVPGLMLVDKKMIYQGTQGEVDCGYMGLSRVFRRPTLYLNGNCSLESRITGHWDDMKVKVILKVK